ncbi:cytochrome P450 [Aspergillus pseudocaelatus]|uniref:Cytochrome P450 n=1 Tax=Aspergillus pseudocaelatus TaxID=1825620 RepID=A0ABQ6X188_9EURO|nr:cytochrome P450 [Aspergillus pseudocaelatus]
MSLNTSIDSQYAKVAVGSATLGIFLLLLHQLYRRLLLPKPIPNIPYNVAASQKLLGDLPELKDEMDRTSDMRSWLLRQTIKLQYPLIQLFLDPFSKPILILSDPREALDILLYRSRDFDRAPMLYDIFSGLAPTHHIGMKTGPEWRRHRDLIQHLVTQPFLQDTAGPAIHASASRLVRLWRAKARVAQGAAFAAKRDFQYMIIDALIEICFGKDFPNNGVSSQIELLEAYHTLAPDVKPQTSITFPEANPHEFICAHKKITEAIEHCGQSVYPRQMWWAMSKLPRLANALRIKRRVTRERLITAAATIAQKMPLADSSGAWSSAEFMAHHENNLSQQECRQPEYISPPMEDELYGFLFAGSHTNFITLAWAIKTVADNPVSQSRLRDALRAGFPEAVLESRAPSPSEMSSRQIPYLNATVEEILRICPATLLVDRVAIRDTELLGYHVPKGTCIWTIPAGAGFTSPAHHISEEKRNASSRSNAKHSRRSEWSGDDIAQFIPERWLRPSAEKHGELVFDPSAGPILAFGAGPRGCFGRPLAYLQLRMAVALFVWNFELLKCPDSLSSYDAADGLFHKPKSCYVSLRELSS